MEIINFILELIGLTSSGFILSSCIVLLLSGKAYLSAEVIMKLCIICCLCAIGKFFISHSIAHLCLSCIWLFDALLYAERR